MKEENKMRKNEQNRVICVLGMHRSGTSMLMRVLNICGIYIGEDKELFPPTPHNPLGHWELLEVIQINDEILKTFGGWYLGPPDFPVDWHNDKRLEPIYEKAKCFVDKMNSRNLVWGMKDPRLCLTLSFWKKIIPDMTYVISIRDSYEVALSLEKRNHITIIEGLYLWSRYWSSIVENTDGQHRVFTLYDNYFEDWKNEIEKVIKFIDIPSIDFHDKAGEIESFISSPNRHHRSLRKSLFKINQESLDSKIKDCLIEELTNNLRISLDSYIKIANVINT